MKRCVVLLILVLLIFSINCNRKEEKRVSGEKVREYAN